MATDNGLREEAVERIKERRGFIVHLVIYAIVNVAMLALWAVSGGGSYASAWLAFGWGIGVAFHGLAVLIEDQQMSTQSLHAPEPEFFDDSFRKETPDWLAERRGFFIHLGVYLAVNAGLLFVSAATGEVGTLPLWVTLGWGIGVAAHGVIMAIGHRQPDEAKVRSEIDRLERHTQGPLHTA